MTDWNDVYPKWAQKVKWFHEDTIIEDLAEDGSDDDASDRVKAVALAAICAEFGHWVEDDQCMFPRHRFCMMCNTLMPNIPVGHYQLKPPRDPFCRGEGPCSNPEHDHS